MERLEELSWRQRASLGGAWLPARRFSGSSGGGDSPRSFARQRDFFVTSAGRFSLSEHFRPPAAAATRETTARVAMTVESRAGSRARARILCRYGCTAECCCFSIQTSTTYVLRPPEYSGVVHHLTLTKKERLRVFMPPPGAYRRPELAGFGQPRSTA